MKVQETRRGIKLYEISDDIFSLNSTINTGNTGKPLGTVHAYSEFDSYWDCEKRGQDFYGQEVKGIRPKYLEDADNLISEHPGPLINIESRSTLHSTADHIAKNIKKKKYVLHSNWKV